MYVKEKDFIRETQRETVRKCVCVCVCVRDREKEKGREKRLCV